MSKKREPIITLQMPMSAVLIAEVLQGVAYVYPHASVEVEPVWGRQVEIHLTRALDENEGDEAP